MRCQGFLLLFAILCLPIKNNAQLNTNELPVSFGLERESISRCAVKTVTMPQLDMEKIEAEDELNEERGLPPRFGYRHKVNYNLTNSGTWTELSNGDKLWRLNVICPNALSVNFCYDKFWIPEGGKLFVYSKDKRHSIGAFTSRNNKGDSSNIRGFATGLVYGNDVVLEYYQPKDVSESAIISIEYVVHGYRYISNGERAPGLSCDYMVNVNCEEGQDWQVEKKAVAKLILQGYAICSGALINTADLSEKPYLLTANHCIDAIGMDATGNTDLDYTLFYWNYETPGCYNLNILPYYSTEGATVVASNSESDFALLRLSEDPLNLPDYTPYYLGWNCSGQPGGPGVCIHHPKGDAKKISTVNGQPVSYDYTFWRVYWKQTTNGHGVTQAGSSGSPLLNSSHQVIGQLYASTCHECADLNGYSLYGKFSESWTGCENDTIERRLSHWIDSLNIGIQAIEGLLVIQSSTTISINQALYSNIRVTSSGILTIQSEIELKGNSRVIVESGGQLVIDGGTLTNVDIELKTGASLRIRNGGILETRNGFVAPMGTTVDIEYGQIM